MNKYTEPSYFEINKKVAEKLGLAYEVTRYGVVTRMSNKEQWREFNPCNNVEQAWEIMMKYNICVTKEPRGNYDAFEGLVIKGVDNADWVYDTWHSKPLVAAMLCFLEM